MGELGKLVKGYFGCFGVENGFWGQVIGLW